RSPRSPAEIVDGQFAGARQQKSAAFSRRTRRVECRPVSPKPSSAFAFHSFWHRIQSLLWSWHLFSSSLLSRGLSCRHFALTNELEFCVVGQRQRRARLCSRRRP